MLAVRMECCSLEESREMYVGVIGRLVQFVVSGGGQRHGLFRIRRRLCLCSERGRRTSVLADSNRGWEAVTNVPDGCW
jgi:hypothetical protein